MSVFCRHNRFVSDCPICSKGTVLDPGRSRSRRSGGGAGRAGGDGRSGRGGARRARAEAGPAPAFSGPHVTAGPYTDADGIPYVVRLERVPGGVRLAEWSGSRLRRQAPVRAAAHVPGIVADAARILAARDAEALAAALRTAPDPELSTAPAPSARSGVSRGRSGEFKEELRVEPLEEERLRIGRWVLRPASGWQLQDAAPMLPAARYAEALADATRKGLLLVAPGAYGAGPS